MTRPFDGLTFDALLFDVPRTYEDTLGEVAAFIDGIARGVPVTVAQGVGVSAVPATLNGVGVNLFDSVAVSGALGTVRGFMIAERVGIAQTQIINQAGAQSVTDWVGMLETLELGETIHLTDGVTITLGEQVAQATRAIERLALAPALTVNAVYARTVSQTLALVDALGRFLGGEAVDGIGLAFTIGGVNRSTPLLTDTVGLAETSAPQLVLRLVASDTIGLDDVDALQLLFNPTLADGVEIAAAYLSPGDGLTTWAMNTRTGAVTEYENYNFNSFAKLGNTYLGANDAGLYALTGDSDAGTDIIATLKSGFTQFAGSRFAAFKAIYLGVRGEGDFILRLITGEGDTFNYAVSTRDMRSTKVHLGKGLRARYFAFELVSTGQDFDLESIEFVPLVADRRV